MRMGARADSGHSHSPALRKGGRLASYLPRRPVLRQTLLPWVSSLSRKRKRTREVCLDALQSGASRAAHAPRSLLAGDALRTHGGRSAAGPGRSR